MTSPCVHGRTDGSIGRPTRASSSPRLERGMSDNTCLRPPGSFNTWAKSTRAVVTRRRSTPTIRPPKIASNTRRMPGSRKRRMSLSDIAPKKRVAVNPRPSDSVKEASCVCEGVKVRIPLCARTNGSSVAIREKVFHSAHTAHGAASSSSSSASPSTCTKGRSRLAFLARDNAAVCRSRISALLSCNSVRVSPPDQVYCRPRIALCRKSASPATPAS